MKTEREMRVGKGAVDGIKNMHKSSKAALTTNENMQKFIAPEIE